MLACIFIFSNSAGVSLPGLFRICSGIASFPMARQAATLDADERRRQFTEVQKIFLAHNPVIYFVAPHVLVATSTRVAPVTPAVTPPQVLWAADEIRLAP